MPRPQRAPLLERLSMKATEWTGSSTAFAVAVGIVLVWIATGPLFGYSDTWQLVINTGTTIVTFLMVFLIQRAQNKESRALQLKLNEIVAALEGASNRLVNVEDLSEGDLAILRSHYARLSKAAAQDGSLTQSHSIEEAEARHSRKTSRQHRPSGRKAGTSHALSDRTTRNGPRGVD